MPDTEILGIPADFEDGITRQMLEDVNADPDDVTPHLTAAQVALAYVTTLNALIKAMSDNPADYMWGPRPILDRDQFERELRWLVAGERRRRFQESSDRHTLDAALRVAAVCCRETRGSVKVRPSEDGYRLHFWLEPAHAQEPQPWLLVTDVSGAWEKFNVYDRPGHYTQFDLHTEGPLSVPVEA